ncbi:helix-turn-helix domain-containing protein [Pseudobacteroides cellulosolvens]|uniref:Transcriptional regulator, XRE family with cupin 2 sensor n=1 Tax=Pseudobacteroides cellulosolvens ATCC 35603 = DSM 2933 TaxID=398512 RepID=A0A0L6JRM4_9FIRM|nr:cupin domain-containing protein [Pseudobacteroides cellulosolvens]KNY28433.1 transcriptional regulator, XRE family with cupin 2 sensor [Pseudobacteroides cellulosolvens ATCC 35603 = DSM 2933]
MSEQIKQIALRIKELREISKVSIEDLAMQLKVPVETYKQYESGTYDIPVSFLYEIANKFNVDLTAILTGEGPKLRTYALVRKDKGIEVNRRTDYKYQHLAYNFLHKKAEPFLVTVEPDQEESPIKTNSHPGQEFNYCLQGTLKIVIDGHEIILNEGDSLFFDSSAKHGMKALNGKVAKFLAIIL